MEPLMVLLISNDIENCILDENEFLSSIGSFFF